MAGPKDILMADSLCHLGNPMASNTKLRVTFDEQAEPELTRILAASNKSIISLLLKPAIAKLMVVGTLLLKLWLNTTAGKALLRVSINCC